MRQENSNCEGSPSAGGEITSRRGGSPARKPLCAATAAVLCAAS